MRSRPDLHPAPGAVLPGGVWPSTGCPRAGPPSEHDDLERGCEVTIQLNLGPPHPSISVAGILGRSGGALLTAVLEYVREQQHGGPVAVDLRGVSHVDRHGLAPITGSGVVLTATSPAVDRVLAGRTRPSRGVESVERSAGSARLPGSGKPSSYEIPRQPHRGSSHHLL